MRKQNSYKRLVPIGKVLKIGGYRQLFAAFTIFQNENLRIFRHVRKSFALHLFPAFCLPLA
jgi:hypothetical protein